MQYSPKLKKAMAEIEAIIKKNDLGGFVIIHTPSFSEYKLFLETTTNCIRKVDTPEGPAYRVKTDPSWPKEKKAEVVNNGVNLLTHLVENTFPTLQYVVELNDVVRKAVKVTDFPGTRTTDQDQNN